MPEKKKKSKPDYTPIAFPGLQMILRCVIRNTQVRFSDKTPKERLDEIMHLLLGENYYDPPKEGRKHLKFKNPDMNVMRLFQLIRKDRLEAKKSGVDLPIKHAVKKYLDVIPSHATSEDNTLRMWAAKYSEFVKETDFENENIIENPFHTDQEEVELISMIRESECFHYLYDMKEIREFLKSKGWPFKAP